MYKRQGYHQHIDPDLVIPDKTLSISQGALSFYGTDEEGYYMSAIRKVAENYGFDLDTPLKDLSLIHIYYIINISKKQD